MGLRPPGARPPALRAFPRPPGEKTPSSREVICLHVLTHQKGFAMRNHFISPWFCTALFLSTGVQAQTIPVSVSDVGQVTLQAGDKLNTPITLTNISKEEVSARVEFVIQQDPSLYSKPAPNPLYGDDIASGCRSWAELQ